MIKKYRLRHLKLQRRTGVDLIEHTLTPHFPRGRILWSLSLLLYQRVHWVNELPPTNPSQSPIQLEEILQQCMDLADKPL